MTISVYCISKERVFIFYIVNILLQFLADVGYTHGVFAYIEVLSYELNCSPINCNALLLPWLCNDYSINSKL